LTLHKLSVAILIILSSSFARAQSDASSQELLLSYQEKLDSLRFEAQKESYALTKALCYAPKSKVFNSWLANPVVPGTVRYLVAQFKDPELVKSMDAWNKVIMRGLKTGFKGDQSGRFIRSSYIEFLMTAPGFHEALKDCSDAQFSKQQLEKIIVKSLTRQDLMANILGLLSQLGVYTGIGRTLRWGYGAWSVSSLASRLPGFLSSPQLPKWLNRAFWAYITFDIGKSSYPYLKTYMADLIQRRKNPQSQSQTIVPTNAAEFSSSLEETSDELMWSQKALAYQRILNHIDAWVSATDAHPECEEERHKQDSVCLSLDEKFHFFMMELESRVLDVNIAKPKMEALEWNKSKTEFQQALQQVLTAIVPELEAYTGYLKGEAQELKAQNNPLFTERLWHINLIFQYIEGTQKSALSDLSFSNSERLSLIGKVHQFMCQKKKSSLDSEQEKQLEELKQLLK